MANENILAFYSDSDRIVIRASDKKVIRNVKRWAEKYPEQCIIFKKPGKNAGYIHAVAPRSWIVFKPPQQPHKKRVSEAQKQHLFYYKGPKNERDMERH